MGLDAHDALWFSTAMKTLLVLIAVLAPVAACGGSPTRGTPSPRATSAPVVATSATATLDGETFVASRTLPAAALSAEKLEAAGVATGDDGSRISMARADSAEAAPWEAVSAAPDGWRVWRPKAVLDVLASAGPGAVLVSAERVSWPDACLGAARPGELCAQVITPGYRVTVEQGGDRIEYHTSRMGAVRTASSP